MFLKPRYVRVHFILPVINSGAIVYYIFLWCQCLLISVITQSWLLKEAIIKVTVNCGKGTDRHGLCLVDQSSISGRMGACERSCINGLVWVYYPWLGGGRM